MGWESLLNWSLNYIPDLFSFVLFRQGFTESYLARRTQLCSVCASASQGAAITGVLCHTAFSLDFKILPRGSHCSFLVKSNFFFLNSSLSSSFTCIDSANCELKIFEKKSIYIKHVQAFSLLFPKPCSMTTNYTVLMLHEQTLCHFI